MLETQTERHDMLSNTMTNVQVNEGWSLQIWSTQKCVPWQFRQEEGII